jgi:hypothetical protein
MSRTLSFRGQLDIGVEERISLHTNTGQTGYRITKFEIMSSTPGVGDVEFIAQIYKTSNVDNINTTPNFSDNRLLGVIFYQDADNTAYPSSTETIFELEIFNQDVFINITSPNGATVRCNYYIEMEVMDLALDESTVATLKDIRNAGSQ